MVVNPTGDEVKVLNEISRKEGSEENSEANQKPSDTEILNPQSSSSMSSDGKMSSNVFVFDFKLEEGKFKQKICLNDGIILLLFMQLN